MDTPDVEFSRASEVSKPSLEDSESGKNKADTDDTVIVNTLTDSNKSASSPAADLDRTTAVTPIHDDSQTTVSELDRSENATTLKEKERFIESFFSKSAVFPVRHEADGELGDMSSVNNAAPKTPLDPDKNDDKIFKDSISFQYDVEAMKKNEATVQSSFATFNQDQVKDENYVDANNDTPEKKPAPSETDAPFNSSLFSCQYQTPSWIDDPLIGVPPSAMENKNTHRKTGADMRILTAYMRSLNELRLPEAIPPNELDKYLSSFFLVVRKADGSEYEPCSLRAMLASIERYLRFKNYPLSLTRDSAFSSMRNVLKLKQQTLRSIGKGQKGHTEVTPSTLAKEGKIAHLFKSQEMGPYTPSSVVFTLCFYFCMYLRLRKSTENKKLLWGDIVLCKDDSGREFLTFSSQMLRQTQGSSKLNLKQRNYRVWADPSCPEKDPVTIYKFYAQKRPVSMNTNVAPFYLGINVLYPTQGQPWYRPAAMGINKLNEMVRQIRDMTGIRSTSDFHGKVHISDKGSEGDGGSVKSEQHSPLSETAERQELEADVKPEIVEDMDHDNDNLVVAMDFSQDHKGSPDSARYSHKFLAGSTQGTDSGLSHATSCSDGDSNDSFPSQSLALNNSHVGVNGSATQELDLTRLDSGDSPLNCSTRCREDSENNDLVNGVCASLQAPDFLSLTEAKQQLINIVQRMEASDVIQMDGWLKKISFCPDPFTGKIVCKDAKEPVQVSAQSVCGRGSNGSKANITLSISLSPEALVPGGGPITVTTQTLTTTSQEPHEEHLPQRSGSAGSDYVGGGTKGFQSTSSSSSSPLHRYTNNLAATLTSHRHSSSSAADVDMSPDKPLDLATSPFNRNDNKSLKTVNSNSTVEGVCGGRNGMFPSSLFDPQPLAKRLRLSAEQAEAYASASIMAAASLSSTNLVNEQLRLQLMQAAGLQLSEGHAHGHNLLDMAANGALRSQLLQHYRIKPEPK